RKLLTAQQHALANNGGVGAKVPLPETVAEDNDVVAPCPEIVSDNVAAQLGGYSQQRKEVGRDLKTLEALRQVLAREIDIPAANCSKQLDPLRLFLPVTEVGRSGWQVHAVLARQ